MIIDLTDDQQKKLQGLMIDIDIMARRGEPGICLAQIYKKHMTVRVLSHIEGLAVKKAFDKFTKLAKLTKG